MKKTNPQIGWQKYESVIEEQLTSTFFSDVLSNILGEVSSETEVEDESEIVYEDEVQQVDNSQLILAKIGMNEKLFEDLGMITNFDCWVAHTNFDITPKIKKDLDSVKGIEILKVFSRYRFFIGVGKMFDFKNVRKNVENLLLNKGENYGYEYQDKERDEES